tara:strand:+ start:118 stop:450 length:333 start_codon:yes stop_codon:yes gene_type:complete
MIGELQEEKPVSLVEIKTLLNDRKKEKELTYEQDLTFKYAKQFAKLTPTQTEKAKKELEGVEGLTTEAIIKIIDIIPTSKELLTMILPKGVELADAQADAVLAITQKFAK